MVSLSRSAKFVLAMKALWMIITELAECCPVNISAHGCTT